MFSSGLDLGVRRTHILNMFRNDIVIARRLVDTLVAGVAGPDGNRLAAAEGGGQVVGWYARAALDLEPRVVEAWRAVKSRGYGRRQGG